MKLVGEIVAGVVLFCLILGAITGGWVWIGMPMMLAVLLGLIAVMFISDSNNDTFIYNDRAMIWRAKFDQVLMKGRSLRADAEFRQTLDYYENMINQK